MASPVEKTPLVVLLGHPNVGKSVLFNRLTGRSAMVSNYPGTTVEVERGRFSFNGKTFEVVDAPGLYSLLPISEEERVARQLLLFESPFLVIHVIDAKNIVRMLPLTLQLLESEIPTLLVLNMMDEAEKLGIQIDFKTLENQLRIPVLGAVSTSGRGVDEIKSRVYSWSQMVPV